MWDRCKLVPEVNLKKGRRMLIAVGEEKVSIRHKYELQTKESYLLIFQYWYLISKCPLQSDFTFMTYPSYTSSIASVHHL
jgi:hypothetical protein